MDLLPMQGIYVNGIRNSLAEANHTKDRIQRHTGIPMELVYNPHGFVSGILEVDWLIENAQEAAITTLSGRIRELIRDKTYIFLIAHSKGTHLALIALDRLHNVEDIGPDLKIYLTIETYGGVGLIPIGYGREVCNVISKCDTTALKGSWINQVNQAVTRSAYAFFTGRSPLLFYQSWHDVWDGNEIQSTAKKKYNPLIIEGLPWSIEDLVLSRQHAFDRVYLTTCAKTAKAFHQHVEDMSHQKKDNRHAKSLRITVDGYFHSEGLLLPFAKPEAFREVIGQLHSCTQSVNILNLIKEKAFKANPVLEDEEIQDLNNRIDKSHGNIDTVASTLRSCISLTRDAQRFSLSDMDLQTGLFSGGIWTSITLAAYWDEDQPKGVNFFGGVIAYWCLNGAIGAVNAYLVNAIVGWARHRISPPLQPKSKRSPPSWIASGLYGIGGFALQIFEYSWLYSRLNLE